jgi:hypothetical protein
MLEWFEAMAADGDPPKALLNRPELEEHLWPIYEAFQSFWGDRHIGPMGGLGAIPFVSIEAYARSHGIEFGDEFERFKRMLGRMDGVYQQWASERLKLEASKNRNSS